MGQAQKTTGRVSLRASVRKSSHRALSRRSHLLVPLESPSGTASSYGQLLRGSFLGQIQIAQIIPVEIV
jgi:hypothetical protein